MINRRDFLRGAGALAALALLPFTAVASVFKSKKLSDGERAKIVFEREKKRYRKLLNKKKYNILNVPIMESRRHELPESDKYSKYFVDFGRKWFKRAIKEFNEMRKEGYLPPIHVGYGYEIPDSESQEVVGFFALTGIRKIKGKLCLCADLIDIKPTVYAMIQDGTLPIRSVSIHPSMHRVESVKLLQDWEAPYFYPPLTSPVARDFMKQLKIFSTCDDTGSNVVNSGTWVTLDEALKAWGMDDAS